MASGGSDTHEEHPCGYTALPDDLQRDVYWSTTQIRLPPFYLKTLRAWFCHLEAQFYLRRALSQMAKYYNLISCLPMELVDEPSDLLTAPAETGA